LVGTVFALLVLVLGVWWAEDSQNPIWESLRPVESAAESLELATSIIVFLLSVGMLVIASMAYQRNPNPKFFFLVLAFGIFVAKFAVKILDHFYSPGAFFSQASQNVFDLFVLGALFLAVLKKD